MMRTPIISSTGHNLPDGTKIRAFSVVVEEIEYISDDTEDHAD